MIRSWTISPRNWTWLHTHHIVFYTAGGPTVRGNVLTLCSACHRNLHNRHLQVRGQAPSRLSWTSRLGGDMEQIPQLEAPPWVRRWPRLGLAKFRGVTHLPFLWTSLAWSHSHRCPTVRRPQIHLAGKTRSDAHLKPDVRPRARDPSADSRQRRFVKPAQMPLTARGPPERALPPRAKPPGRPDR
ncbi:MAG: HNH endonuclease [Armatimonadetes bacterium]|nr:HNH endonuclease [Armatimonadota bacterium]